MEKLSKEDRKKLVKQELNRLKDADYISNETYYDLITAHDNLLQDELIQLEEQSRLEAERAKQLQIASEIEKEKAINDEPVPEPKTAQEIRERNISWSLSIGVIFLIVGGMVLATSTWDILSDWMKTGMITLVAIIFFGLATLTKNILKIEKTALAFYVLGGLFLPIIYLSLGFYEQMGTYLSLTGDGRYFYGALGSLILFPIYIYLAYYLKARLFIWFANVSLTLFGSFFIGWFDLPIDGFYLGIILFNTLLVMVYHLFKHKQGWQLFMREFAFYIQANLILSTLLLIVFYSSEVFHGFNLVLTALVYLGMLFVTNSKNYYFVFVVMLVYGVYQMIEFSALQTFGPITYGLLGFVFLVLPRIIDDRLTLHKQFKYTSAVVSGFAFIFISVQAFLIRMDDPSLILFLAYLLIAGNYIYLGHLSELKNKFFYYLSSVFVMVALFELVRISQTIFGYNTLIFPMFITSFIVYYIVGCLMKISYLQMIKESLRDVTTVIMFGALFLELAYLHWFNSGIMLLLISVVAILMQHYDQRKITIQYHIAELLQVLSLGISVMMFYMAIRSDELLTVNAGPFESVSLVSAGLILLVASFIWKKMNQKKFSDYSFYGAQGFYYLGMIGTLMSFNTDINTIIRSIIFFGGIVMAYLLYRKIRSVSLTYVIASLSLIFYFTVLFVINEYFDITELFISLRLPIGALLLFGVGTIWKRFDLHLKQAYYRVGHLFYPIAFVISLLYGKIGVWSAILATIIYGVSLYYAKKEWLRKVFLYASFTSFWLVIVHILWIINLIKHAHFSFMFTSAILTIIWLLSDKDWRRRIVYYLIPFSMIGLSLIASQYPFELFDLLLTIVYGVLVLALLHIMKWDIFNGIPLLLIFFATINFIDSTIYVDYMLMLLLTVILIPLGSYLYHLIYDKREGALPMLDWYTITGFLAISYLYVYSGDQLWKTLLPGILMSIAIYIQRHRIKEIASKWFVALAAVYLLEPYYTWLGALSIPRLIELEIHLLPLIGLAIFIKQIAGEAHRKLMNNIQWVILVGTAILLIQDALNGNTIGDAILLGTLSLLSLLGGMIFKQKSFFFVGAGVLLLNLFLQTQPLWGALPWWAYLLIVGTILITFASYNEWHKQKTSKGKDTLITLINKKFIQKLKKWE